MQFNRREYLNNNFDKNSGIERKNAYWANHLIGLDWNNYIKGYVKDCLGDAIGTFDYDYQLVMPFATIGPFVDFGLFNQAADFLESLNSENEEFEANKNLWVDRLREADDHKYQKENNPDYQTFTQKFMQRLNKETDNIEEEEVIDIINEETDEEETTLIDGVDE